MVNQLILQSGWIHYIALYSKKEAEKDSNYTSKVMDLTISNLLPQRIFQSYLIGGSGN